MSERYKKIFSLEKNSYKETSPVVIKAGALVQDTETGRLHIQLKMQNISEKKISLLKAKFFLKDAVNRDLEVVEKQYLDLNANSGVEFAGKIPVLIKEQSTRKFNVIVEEVCFEDGEVWSSDENGWEELPIQQPLTDKFCKEAIEEFKKVYSHKSKNLPIRHKDIWFCTCGRVNKNTNEKCVDCGATLSEMEQADNEILKNTNIYAKATKLVNTELSKNLEQGIALLKTIPNWENSTELIEKAQEKLPSIKAQEKKTVKKRTIILSSVLAGITVFMILLFAVIVPTVKRNNYMKAGDYGAVVKMDKLTTFTIPYGTTKIDDYEFSNCGSLESITIPTTVTSIGSNAFYLCKNLRSIVIPDSVTELGEWAFASCDNLKTAILECSASISDSAFYNCKNLETITLDRNITTIGNYAFSGCKKLESCSIPSKVTEIGNGAFAGCISMHSILIPLKVNTIGYDVFKNWEEEQTIYCKVASKPTGWSKYWKDDCSAKVVWGYKA